MKQKKFYFLMLAVILTLGVLLTGCSSDKTAGDQNDVSGTDIPASSDGAESKDSSQTTPHSDSDAPIPHSDKFKVSDGKVTFTDAAGSEVSLTIKPQRVVTLSNNWHDLWFDCGGTAVARVDEELCALRNEDAKSVKVIGGSSTVSLEAVLAENPDLVILGSPSKDGQDMAAALKDAGVEYLLYDYENFEGFLETLELYSILTDRSDLYKKWAAETIAQVNEVRAICAKQTPAQIVMLLPHATNGIYALKNSGFLGSLLEDLNTVNVAFQDERGEDKNFVISMEQLLKLDPQFVLSRGGSGDGSAETATGIYESNPLWFALTAVKEDRYHHLPSDLFLYKANVRYGEAYEYLARILYPDAFAN
ncbi:ABC transporter substrate-binding protein [Anaerolentibacter hominis]|uniref:ABC transporter substrate-binding protein n=1 Tax=Anaerolentibacter hominis TaxID=3079009 RepID=UPI0031B81D7B